MINTSFSGWESCRSDVPIITFVEYFTSHIIAVLCTPKRAMAQQFNRTMSLRTWPSMYGNYEFNDDDENEDTKVNWEQVK